MAIDYRTHLRPTEEQSAVEEKMTESYVHEDVTAPERGALWLDEHYPGWYKKINLKTFDIQSSSECVCGQVFAAQARRYARGKGGNWQVDGYDWFDSYSRKHQNDDATNLGFRTPGSGTFTQQDKEWNRYQRLWEAEITKRRDQPVAG